VRILENRALGDIFGHNMEEETGDWGKEWGKVCHVELPKLYGSPNIIKVNKLGRMR
jgi:hypothetical protein